MASDHRRLVADALLQAEQKLEDVRNQIDEFPCVHVQDYQRMMRKIEKILEAEG